jgi:hypothetical protein
MSKKNSTKYIKTDKIIDFIIEKAQSYIKTDDKLFIESQIREAYEYAYKAHD